MRLLCVAALVFAACGAEAATPVDEAQPTEPTGAAVDPAEEPPDDDSSGLPRPARGGTVVAVGPHPVEVLVGGDGAVEVLARGERFPAPAQVLFTITIPGEDGDQHPVVLVWDPARESFRGLMRAALPIPGAIELKLLIDEEQTFQGRSPTVVVSAPPVASTAPQHRPHASRAARPGSSSASPSDRVAAPEDVVAPPAVAPLAPPPLTDRVRPPVAEPAPAPVLEAARPGVDLRNRRGRASASPRPTRPVEPERRAIVRVRE